MRYRSWDVFSLGSRCLPTSHGQTKPWYSGARPHASRWLTPTGLSPSTAGRSRPLRLNQQGGWPSPVNPTSPSAFAGGSVWALPLSVAPTQGIPCWFLFLPLLRCFRSGGSLSVLMASRIHHFPECRRLLTRGGYRHSEIPGSKAACASPGRIAACHVLPRRPSRAIHQAASAFSLTSWLAWLTAITYARPHCHPLSRRGQLRSFIQEGCPPRLHLSRTGSGPIDEPLRVGSLFLI